MRVEVQADFDVLISRTIEKPHAEALLSYLIGQSSTKL